MNRGSSLDGLGGLDGPTGLDGLAGLNGPNGLDGLASLVARTRCRSRARIIEKPPL